MARTKQRETYGNGSVSPVKVPKVGKDGNAVIGKDGKPVRIQQVDRDGKPVWRVAITLGVEKYVDSKGNVRKRQRKVQRLVHGTLADARSVCKKLVDDYENVDVAKARDCFSALVDEWSKSEDTHYDDGSLTCSQKQLNQYLRHLGYVARYLDEKALVDLTRDDVNTALAQVAQTGKNGRPLSSTTMEKIRQLVRRVFEYAVAEEYLVRNPIRPQRRRKKPSSSSASSVRQRRALSEEEAARLCAALDGDEATAYRLFAEKEQRQGEWGTTFGRSSLRGVGRLSCLVAVRLMLATGMRRGEALALTWGNVDLGAGTVRIVQSLTETMEVKSPKTDNGYRTICLDADTVEHLKTWKAFQKEALHLIMRPTPDGKEKRPVDQTDSTPVCCSDVGAWMDPTNVYRWWSGYREERGFSGLLLHEMRHTQITLLRNSGVSDELIKLRVGHARDNSVTWQYTHESVEKSRLASKVIGSILYGKRPAGEVVEMERRTA